MPNSASFAASSPTSRRRAPPSWCEGNPVSASRACCEPHPIWPRTGPPWSWRLTASSRRQCCRSRASTSCCDPSCPHPVHCPPRNAAPCSPRSASAKGPPPELFLTALAALTLIVDAAGCAAGRAGRRRRAVAGCRDERRPCLHLAPAARRPGGPDRRPARRPRRAARLGRGHRDRPAADWTPSRRKRCSSGGADDLTIADQRALLEPGRREPPGPGGTADAWRSAGVDMSEFGIGDRSADHVGWSRPSRPGSRSCPG